MSAERGKSVVRGKNSRGCVKTRTPFGRVGRAHTLSVPGSGSYPRFASSFTGLHSTVVFFLHDLKNATNGEFPRRERKLGPALSIAALHRRISLCCQKSRHSCVYCVNTFGETTAVKRNAQLPRRPCHIVFELRGSCDLFGPLGASCCGFGVTEESKVIAK
jgi:hypothetical protein